ncbi:MAG: hypothetical protein Ta2A_22420 [Treponemataceae bacterium]|nr:MAG: hypothetical protein Ta2A_22420 [Treponemataceae bacterium]
MKTNFFGIIFVLTFVVILSGCINDLSTDAKIQINNKASESYDVRFLAENNGADAWIVTVPANSILKEKTIPQGRYILYLKKTSGGDWTNAGSKYYSGGIEKTETISSSGAIN